MSALKILERLKMEAWSGALEKASLKTLNEYAAALCVPQAFTVFSSHEFPQISETVRTHLLRAHVETLQLHVVELHGHITNLNGSNTKLQKLVVALTVASLIGTGAQLWFAAKADKKFEEKLLVTTSQKQISTVQSVAPIQTLVPSSGQAEKKPP